VNPTGLRRSSDIRGPEREAIFADLREVILKYGIAPGTVGALARLAAKEMRP
jgi:hypothetical protein